MCIRDRHILVQQFLCQCAILGQDTHIIFVADLDEYMQGFQERNPTLRVFGAFLHMRCV